MVILGTLRRIADALERIADVAERVHPPPQSSTTEIDRLADRVVREDGSLVSLTNIPNPPESTSHA